MKVYLDNASTTTLLPEVIASITEVLENYYGNPSSTHQWGREGKGLIEMARKNIAKHFNCSAQEILFTSGGTEGDNWIISNAVLNLGVRRIVTTKIEHHAVLSTIEHFEKENKIEVVFLALDAFGQIALDELEEILSINTPTLVSLMHINNEIGTLIDIEQVAKICKKYEAYFHSDTIQSIGKTTIDLQKVSLDYLVASAHKFHGPKGVGFVFARKGVAFSSIFYGGSQEKGLRAGTEAIHQIVGMEKALSLAYDNLEENKSKIEAIKKYAVDKLKEAFPEIKFNGGKSTFYTILNILLPFDKKVTSTILFSLDIKGIAVSRGSACQSGSLKPSHVLNEILKKEEKEKPSLRLSFSHFNTREEIDYFISVLKELEN